MAQKTKNAVPAGYSLYGKVLLAAACILATVHMLVAEFRYVIDTDPFWLWERRGGLALVIALVLWLAYGLAMVPGTADRLKAFFKSLRIYEYIYVAGMFAWLLIDCAVRQDLDGVRYFRYDWWFFDAALYSFILFPAARYLGKENARKRISLMLDAVTLSYTVFAVWAMTHVFSLNVVTLPSGSQVGMSKSFELILGCHYNLTGAISLTLFVVSCWMCSTRGKVMRWIYGFAAAVHFYIAMLSNSRAVYTCLLALGAATAFFTAWRLLRDRKTAIRLLCSVGAAAVVAVLVWALRKGSFWSFDALTGFTAKIGQGSGGSEAIREMSGLSGRERVWASALKVMGSGPNTLIFGVTPFSVTEALQQIGGLDMAVAHAHNEILQVGTALGVPAMIAFVVFLVRIAYRGFRVLFLADRPENAPLMMAVIAAGTLILLNMAEAYLNVYYSIMSCVFFLLCGVITEGTRKEPALPEITTLPQKAAGKKEKNTGGSRK